jgi:hypothetical protein
MSPYDDDNPSEMSCNDLFRELKRLTQKLQRLEELKAPKVIIDYEQERFHLVLNELLKHMSMATIEKEMQTKWLNKKWRDTYEQ